jgi:hypothetical protein
MPKLLTFLFLIFNSAVFLIYKQKIFNTELRINCNDCGIYPKDGCLHLVHISANLCVLGAVGTCGVFCKCVCLKKCPG